MRQIIFFLSFAVLLYLPVATGAFTKQKDAAPEQVREQMSFLLEYFTFHARNNNTDEMESTYEFFEMLSSEVPSSYARLHILLLDFEKLTAREHYSRAIPLAEELIEKVEQTEYEELKASIYIRYSQALLVLGFEEESEEYLVKAERIFSNYPDNFSLHYQIVNARAFHFAQKTDFATTFELFFELIQELEKMNDENPDILNRIRLANTYGSLALEMANLGITEDAITYLNKALEMSREIGDQAQVIRHLNNLNVAYERQNDHEKAIEVLLEARELSNEIGNYSSVIRIEYNLGIQYVNIGEPERALPFFTEGLERSRELNSSPGMLHHSYGLADAHRMLGNLTEARTFFIQAEELSKELKSKAILTNTYKNRYLLEKEAGNFEMALMYHELFKEMDDEYKEVARSQVVEELMIQHRVETTRSENEFLAEQLLMEEQANQQKNMFIIILGLLFIVTVGFAYYFFKVKGQLQAANGVLDIQKNRIAAKNAKLEKLSQQRNAFLHVIIHDLRNPLSTIDGASQILQMNETPDTPDEMRELTDIIVSSSKRMNLLISSLLNVFEKDNSNIDSELEEVNAKDMILKVISDFKPLIVKKQMALSTELEEVVIITHPESVIGILSNLISNAIKYSSDRTEVTVLSGVKDDKWEIVVRDQGPGFSDNDFENIFKPFAKLSATPTGDETSTGVGLYSVKTSIDRLQGEIVVNREYTEGAEFICTIPVKVVSEQLETAKNTSAF